MLFDTYLLHTHDGDHDLFQEVNDVVVSAGMTSEAVLHA